ncbi:MAG: hypothetical protein QM760_04250 [Nibricoccus sp.]
MKRIISLLGLVLLFGCAAPPKKEAQWTKADGSSYDRAFVIQARSQTEGIAEERSILDQFFPGARQAEAESVGKEEIVFGHTTQVRDKRVFSVHTLVLRDGTVREVYFDITAYFLK